MGRVRRILRRIFGSDDIEAFPFYKRKTSLVVESIYECLLVGVFQEAKTLFAIHDFKCEIESISECFYILSVALGLAAVLSESGLTLLFMS